MGRVCEIRRLRRRVRVGEPDPSLTRYSGMAAVTELVDRLAMIRLLDAAIGPIKVRDRGFGGGELLVGMACAQLAGEDFLVGLPEHLRDRFVLLGQVSETDKARMLASVDVYCAPNTGGESFGVILLEAMAAGRPVVASDLPAFRRVLENGRAGRLFPTGDPVALADALREVLGDSALRAELVTAGTRAVAPYDWAVIVGDVLRVYELAIAGTGAPV